MMEGFKSKLKQRFKIEKDRERIRETGRHLMDLGEKDKTIKSETIELALNCQLERSLATIFQRQK